MSLEERRQALEMALWSAVWMTQACVLALRGARRGGGFFRLFAAGVGLVAVLTILIGCAIGDGWRTDLSVVLHPAGLLALLSIALAVVVSLRLARARADLSPSERWSPEIWSLAASVALLFWSAREAGHVSLLLAGGAPPGAGSPAPGAVAQVRTVAAAITSGAWLVEAVLLLVIGWLRGSAFLRWCGLLLFGLTVLKFLLFDLQNVDVFWRFLTAIVAGAAMLAMSYAYQARARSRAARS